MCVLRCEKSPPFREETCDVAEAEEEAEGTAVHREESPNQCATILQLRGTAQRAAGAEGSRGTTTTATLECQSHAERRQRVAAAPAAAQGLPTRICARASTTTAPLAAASPPVADAPPPSSAATTASDGGQGQGVRLPRGRSQWTTGAPPASLDDARAQWSRRLRHAPARRRSPPPAAPPAAAGNARRPSASTTYGTTGPRGNAAQG